MPNRLLESNASLRRLKDGLVDAQLRTAALLGTMSAEHPKVRTAKETETEIGRNLHNELAAAQRGIEIELRLCSQRRSLLEEQLANATQRLAALAELRAGYTNLVADAKNRAVLLERAEGNLAEARAARASAKATSLISRIDTPDAGIRPIGPGRVVIALCGVVAGLLAGLGIVFLAVPVAAPVTVPAAGANGHPNIGRCRLQRLVPDSSRRRQRPRLDSTRARQARRQPRLTAKAKGLGIGELHAKRASASTEDANS